MRRSRRTPRTSRCASPTDIDESGEPIRSALSLPSAAAFVRHASPAGGAYGTPARPAGPDARTTTATLPSRIRRCPTPDSPSTCSAGGLVSHRPGQFGRVDHGQPGDPHRHHRLRPGRRNLRRGDAGGAAADAGAVHHLRRGRLPAADPWLGLRLPVVRPRALLRDHRHAVGLPDRPCVRRHRRDHAQRHHGAGQLRVAEYPHRAGLAAPGWWASAWCSASAC